LQVGRIEVSSVTFALPADALILRITVPDPYEIWGISGFVLHNTHMTRKPSRLLKKTFRSYTRLAQASASERR
jgi:hypothetical protein